MRILFVCRGRPGLGHVMPAIAVDQALRSMEPSSYQSWIASYGLATSAIESEQLIKLEYPYAGVGYPGIPILRGLWPNLDEVVRRVQPDLVVGSGEFLLPFYGVVTGMKTVMIANLRYLRINEGYFGKIRPALAWLNDQAALIVDYSIDGSHRASDSNKNTIWVGPLVRQAELGDVRELRSRLDLPPNGQVVLITKGGGEEFSSEIVDGKGSRDQQEELNLRLLETAIETASMHRSNEPIFFVIITGLGNLYDRVASVVARSKLLHVRCLQFSRDIMEYIAAADIVVGRGGVSLIGEAVFHRKPQILIPIHSDSEQLANAKYLADRNAAVCIPTDCVTPSILNDAIMGLLGDLDSAQKMARQARDLFPRIDEAPQTAARAIHSLWRSLK